MFRWRVSLTSREGPWVYHYDLGLLRKSKDQAVWDNRYNVGHLTLSWLALLSDSPLSSQGHKPRKLYKSLAKDLISEFRGTIRAYSDLADKLLRALGQDLRSNADLFRDFRKTPIFREFHQFTKTSDPALLTFISSFLMFGKKLYFEDEQLNATALRSWRAVEEKLASTELDDSVLGALKPIVSTMFADMPSFDVLLPKHGSGAVYERGVRGTTKKNQSMSYDAKVDHLFFRNGLHGVDSSRILPDGVDWSESLEKEASPRTSRVMFVPKSYKTMRTICMEPVTFMYSQQAVRVWLEKWIRRGPIRDFVKIHDQGFNRGGAQYGSEHGLVDTIDLSAASDSVSWGLVKSIFPTKVLKYLHGTRTTKMLLPDGEVVVPVKYAPMGSALCFPVQTIIYTAVCHLAAYIWYRGEKGEPITSTVKKVPLRNIYQRTYTGKTAGLHPPRVYGDDIICDTRITDIVVELLRLLGFSVNTEKSFTGDSPYRESCGGHYFYGEDVTPMLYRVKKLNDAISPDTFASVADLCNRSYEYGFLTLRRFLIRTLLYYRLNGVEPERVGNCRVNPVRFTNDEDQPAAIVTRGTCRNQHLRKHRLVDPKVVASRDQFEVFRNAHPEEAEGYEQVRCVGVAPRRKTPKLERFANYEYVLWQRSKYTLEGSDGACTVSSKYEASGKRYVRRWTPAR